MKEIHLMRMEREVLIAHAEALSKAATRVEDAIISSGEMALIKAQEGLKHQNDLCKAAIFTYNDALDRVTKL